MELEQLKSVWSDYNKKLDKSLSLNLRILREMNLDKAKSKLRSLILLRSAEAGFFVVIILGLLNFIADNFSASVPTMSAFVLNLFATIGLVGSIGQMALITMIDYSGPITSIQKQLAKIKSHNIQILRLVILSIPFYMAYIFFGFKFLFNINLYAVADPKWLTANILFSMGLIIPTLWLCRELGSTTPRKWVRQLIEGSGGKQISAALEVLNEVEQFESEAPS